MESPRRSEAIRACAVHHLRSPHLAQIDQTLGCGDTRNLGLQPLLDRRLHLGLGDRLLRRQQFAHRVTDVSHGWQRLCSSGAPAMPATLGRSATAPATEVTRGSRSNNAYATRSCTGAETSVVAVTAAGRRARAAGVLCRDGGVRATSRLNPAGVGDPGRRNRQG